MFGKCLAILLHEALDAIQNKRISKNEALEKYNSVIGVSDVSFDVKQGEIFCVMGLIR
jgi:glycine betaine/proline transport system ATP-binding protein